MKAAPVPNPLEIKQRAEEIRKSWTKSETNKRAGRTAYATQIVDSRHLFHDRPFTRYN